MSESERSELERQHEYDELIRRETRRVVLASVEAGIPDECIGMSLVSLGKIVSNDKHACEVMSDIYARHTDKKLWSKFLLIEGGTWLTRRQVGSALLYRLILRRVNERGQIGMVVKMGHLMTIMNSFDNPRFNIVRKLCKMPALFLEEWDKTQKPSGKTAANARAMIDTILDHRMKYSLPTIISFQGSINDFAGEKAFGEIFDWLASTPESESSDKLCRFRIPGVREATGNSKNAGRNG